MFTIKIMVLDIKTEEWRPDDRYGQIYDKNEAIKQLARIDYKVGDDTIHQFNNCRYFEDKDFWYLKTRRNVYRASIVELDLPKNITELPGMSEKD